jgi:hypothetical protein
MRYDDPKRPISDIGAVHTPMQVSGSPLPTITLMYPMRDGTANEVAPCSGECGSKDRVGFEGAEGCKHCVLETGEWGWLCCVHAHRASNRFGTYYGWIRDLGQFQADYLADPEAALAKHFKYTGPDWEPSTNSPRATQEIKEEIF